MIHGIKDKNRTWHPDQILRLETVKGRCEDNIKTDPKATGHEGVDCIHLINDKVY